MMQFLMFVESTSRCQVMTLKKLSQVYHLFTVLDHETAFIYSTCMVLVYV